MEWREFLERLTADHQGDEVTIEVLSPEIGDQEEAERLAFSYLEYDNKDDVVVVAVGGRDGRYPLLRHMIGRPRRILVDPPSPHEARAIDVEDRDGTHTIVTLHPRG
ncbi:MAG: DUF5335 family protein [Actinobacteria bacterium]|nr:DUF5335 family protein [Actinomycetota bacterium]